MDKKNLMVITVMFFFAAVLSAETVNEQRIRKMFAGLDYFKYSVPYAKKSEMYLGYDGTDMAVKGVAVEKADIYKKITIVIGVDRTESGFNVDYLNIPDINKITDLEKRKRLSDIVSRFKGLSVEINNGDYSEVDAVSGATRFVEKGHEIINNLIRSLVSEMEGNPDWERKKLKS